MTMHVARASNLSDKLAHETIEEPIPLTAANMWCPWYELINFSIGISRIDQPNEWLELECSKANLIEEELASQLAKESHTQKR